MRLPLEASQSRTVASPPAEAMVLPSWLNTTTWTGPVWPVRGWPMGLPVAASHSRTVWSPPAEAIVLPSGLNASPKTRPVQGLPIGLPVEASHSRRGLPSQREPLVQGVAHGRGQGPGRRRTGGTTPPPLGGRAAQPRSGAAQRAPRPRISHRSVDLEADRDHDRVDHRG